MLEGLEFETGEERDGELPSGTQAPCNVSEEAIKVARCRVDQRVPSKHSAEALVVNVEVAGTADPVRDVRVAGSCMFDELGDGIDTLNHQAVPVKETRPLARAAPGIQDQAVNLRRPGKHIVSVVFRRFLDAPERVNVLCGPSRVGVTDGGERHAAIL